MKVIAGLGNPGAKYETTRHNIGFLAVDRLVERWRAIGPNNRNLAEVFSADFKGEKCLLMKPQTFMNLSGRSVAPVLEYYKCQPSDLIVIHDELDLPPLSLRIKTGGGAGGHNGIKSIDENLGAGRQGYHRVRVGIGHPAKLGLRIGPADYVLQPFSEDEWAGLDPLLDKVADAIELLVQGEVTKAMNQFNAQKESGNGV